MTRDEADEPESFLFGDFPDDVQAVTIDLALDIKDRVNDLFDFNSNYPDVGSISVQWMMGTMDGLAKELESITVAMRDQVSLTLQNRDDPHPLLFGELPEEAQEALVSMVRNLDDRLEWLCDKKDGIADAAEFEVDEILDIADSGVRELTDLSVAIRVHWELALRERGEPHPSLRVEEEEEDDGQE